MNYEEWERSVPQEITGDSLWKMEAYRLGLFVADVGWHDVTKLMRGKRTLDLSGQLYRALGSISLPDICRETRFFLLSEQADRCFQGFLGREKASY
jgi:hypothetical protein